MGQCNHIAMRSKQRKTYKINDQGSSRFPGPQQMLRKHKSSDRDGNSLGKQGHMRQSVRPKLKEENQQIELLTKENEELRRQIVDLKVNQFYHFDDKKLKELITEVEQLRKQLKSTQKELEETQMQVDFLKRTNQHLKTELERDIGQRKKEDSLQDSTKCSLKHQWSRTLQDNVTQLSSSPGIHSITNTTLEEALDSYKPNQSSNVQTYLPEQPPTRRTESRSSRKKLLQRCVSPFRAKGQQQQQASESANEYLLYRRNKSPFPRK